MDGDYRDLDASPSERELQVLHLLATQRRKLEFLAASRCTHDGRLLAGVCRLSDGLWAWHSGSRLSPTASRTEVASWHLDMFDSEEFTPQIYRQADHLADEILGDVPRYEKPATVMQVFDCDSDGGVRVGRWRGTPHALQFFAGGLPLFEHASCNCRRSYQVQMLALIHAGVRADAGTLPRGIHVKTLPVECARRSAGVTGMAYLLTDKGVEVTLDE
ncbi:hypothetical protein AMK25_05415 [Micromonospora sp. TSRI0369]|nr:hypothetical protein AMK25_05415 [Micromonospora sp. TSRI0369]